MTAGVLVLLGQHSYSIHSRDKDTNLFKLPGTALQQSQPSVAGVLGPLPATVHLQATPGSLTPSCSKGHPP
jgi:hypothetical protein